MNMASAGGAALEQLLAHIQEELAHECAQIELRAQQLVRHILRDARREARQRVSAALVARRQDLELRCTRESAGVDTKLRRQRQRKARAVIDDGWPLLEAELARCWQSSENRVRWAGAALRLAQSRLIGGPWEVRHPQDWPESERIAALRAADIGNVELHWHADARVDAGLRIEAGGACIDSSRSGLLARREEVEGLLLAAIEDAASERTR